MRITASFDDSAAHLPLSIRGADAIWDRATELRNAPGVHLVELTTQHMLNTGAVLIDELATYFDTGAPSEADPYALAECYARRTELEDLLRDLRDLQPELTAFGEVEMLFPVTYDRELPLLLALTAVGYPAFGYARAYRDSDGGEYYGLVVNLAEARAHVEQQLGQFSLSRLGDLLRHGFFNHHAFLLAYRDFTEVQRHGPERLADQLRDALLSRGIAWHLSYRHDPAFYDAQRDPGPVALDEAAATWERLLATARKHKGYEDSLAGWLSRQPDNGSAQSAAIDQLGYHAARTVAAAHGNKALRDSVVNGPDHFIDLFNAASGDIQLAY